MMDAQRIMYKCAALNPAVRLLSAAARPGSILGLIITLGCYSIPLIPSRFPVLNATSSSLYAEALPSIFPFIKSD